VRVGYVNRLATLQTAVSVTPTGALDNRRKPARNERPPNGYRSVAVSITKRYRTSLAIIRSYASLT
jgi:hypothetical protein